MSEKKTSIHLSRKAKKALAQLNYPLIVECEMYFSCLIRKRVLFSKSPGQHAIPIPQQEKNIQLYFRPIMTKTCSLSDTAATPETEAFPIKKPEPFMPKKVTIKIKKGKWIGEYS